MRLTAFQIGPTAPTLRPASPRRQWMDATTRKFAYRCLPLTIANQHGWELLCPCSFEALWSGGSSIDAVRVVHLGGGKGRMADSHFGEGVITFHPGYLFRSDAPHNLMVTGPINTRKDGIIPLTGIVETDWLPFGFTMNWAFTRPGVVVRFEEGEPFCQVFPLDCAVVESVQPEIRALASEPGLQAQYDGWSSTRNAFNQGLQDPQSQASQDEWQRYYNRGTLHTGEPVEATHRTRLKLCPFVHDASDANGHAIDASEAEHGHVPAEEREHARRGGLTRASVGDVPPALLASMSMAPGQDRANAGFPGHASQPATERPLPAMAETAITEPGPPPAGPDPAEDASGAALVVAPWVVIENLEDDYVVAFDPRGDTRLKLARPIYELFRRFALPTWVESVLPPEPLRRDRALQALRHLETRGLLARPAAVFAGNTHTPAT